MLRVRKEKKRDMRVDKKKICVQSRDFDERNASTCLCVRERGERQNEIREGANESEREKGGRRWEGEKEHG